MDNTIKYPLGEYGNTKTENNARSFRFSFQIYEKRSDKRNITFKMSGLTINWNILTKELKTCCH